VVAAPAPATADFPKHARINLHPAISIRRYLPADSTFHKYKEQNMRPLLVFALAFATFVGTMTIATPDAKAVVCAAGVYRAGCVGPRGGAVVTRPVAACRYVVIDGISG
jgi:hypothetical protein